MGEEEGRGETRLTARATLATKLAMLTSVDRVQVAVADAASAGSFFERLLGAVVLHVDHSPALAAHRTILALGSSQVELLEPDGAGPVADFLARAPGGLFAAGVSTADLPGLRARLRRLAIDAVEDNGRLLLAPEASGIPGLRAVVSADEARKPAGLLRGLYEVTLLASDPAPLVRRTAEVFGLDETHFAPIRSAEYGYEGTLTLFDPARLDRLEIIAPRDPAKTMGRFFARRGPALYMCYAEAEQLAPVRDRLLEHAPGDWTGPRDGAIDNLFIHPRVLGGMMMGVSRTGHAWTWSGRPERAAPTRPA